MAEALRPGAGGISGLRQLLREHGEAVEADLRSVYGVRLRELFTGGMTWRELGVYVRAMPTGSATRTALNKGRPEPTGEQVLLADVFDILQHVDWHVQAANVEKESKLPAKPKPYPRWWLADAGRKSSSERVAKLDAARQRRQQRAKAIAEGRIA